MEITVKNKFQKGSARKIRPILAVIRGKNTKTAMEFLKFTNKNGAVELYKMINNGVAQAEENNIAANNLIVKKVQCDKAKELKRHRFESKGRVARIKKHQHHITLILSDAVNKNKPEMKTAENKDLKVESKKEK